MISRTSTQPSIEDGARAPLRRSTIRDAVLALLMAAPAQAFTAVEIYSELIDRKRCSLRTVYRVAEQLEHLGMLERTGPPRRPDRGQDRWQFAAAPRSSSEG